MCCDNFVIILSIKYKWTTLCFVFYFEETLKKVRFVSSCPASPGSCQRQRRFAVLESDVGTRLQRNSAKPRPLFTSCWPPVHPLLTPCWPPVHPICPLLASCSLSPLLTKPTQALIDNFLSSHHKYHITQPCWMVASQSESWLTQ